MRLHPDGAAARVAVLPAVAAIAPVAAISTIAASPAAATTAAVTTATTTTAAAIAAATTTPTAARLLRTRFVDHQIAASEVLPVHGIHGAIGFFIVRDFHERKAARLPRETIADEVDCGRGNTCLGKMLVQGIFRGGKRKISNVKLLH